nr:MAG TPA: hypothetical protein [Bacteriophage sp.]
MKIKLAIFEILFVNLHHKTSRKNVLIYAPLFRYKNTQYLLNQ